MVNCGAIDGWEEKTVFLWPTFDGHHAVGTISRKFYMSETFTNVAIKIVKK